jgi:probable F420-dependent oxidoreductase
MEIGVVLPNAGHLATKETVFTLADRAEEWGLDALWTVEHLALPRSPTQSYPYLRVSNVTLDPEQAFLEPLITLAIVAARTERVKLGVGVFLAPLRHPLISAKMAASLDQLSSGRLILGVGLGWIPEEYEAVGVSWAERGAILDEQIRYFREVWSSDTPEFRGRFYTLKDMGFEPKPVHQHVPIWVGGNGTRAMNRAARLGDSWHLIDLPPSEVESKLQALARACQQADRPRRQVSLSMRAMLQITESPVQERDRLFPLTGTQQQVIADLREYKRLGVEHMALAPWAMDVDLRGYLERVEVIAKEIKPALLGSS